MPETLAAIEEGSTWEHTEKEYEVEITEVVLFQDTHELKYIEYEVTDDEWLQEQVETARKHVSKSCIEHVSVDVKPARVGAIVQGEAHFRRKFTFVDTA